MRDMTTKERNLYKRNVEQLKSVLSKRFSSGDFFVTLCFDDVPLLDGKPDTREFRKCIDKFLRELRSAYQNDGAEFKYITVLETTNEHYSANGDFKFSYGMHAHIMIPKSNINIESFWNRGFCHCSSYKCDCGFMARFMIKNSETKCIVSKNIERGGME